MEINFRVVDVLVNPLDTRCSAHPGVECAVVRLKPVEDVHAAAVGDVVVVLPKADADKLSVEAPAVEATKIPDPRTSGLLLDLPAKPAVTGTKAVLTIG